LQNQFKHKTFLKAVLDGIIVGSVRGYLKGKTVHIGRLAVEPHFQNRGIGTQLIWSIEAYSQVQNDMSFLLEIKA
jgi:ribosomal protein S18 acetylase RimI-like enzyme